MKSSIYVIAGTGVVATGVAVTLNTNMMVDPPTPEDFAIADVTGNAWADSLDKVAFDKAFASGNLIVDFNNDLVVDLVDTGIFKEAYSRVEAGW